MRRAAAPVLVVLFLAASQARVGAEWPGLAEEASAVGEGHYSVSAGVSRTWQDSRRLPGGKGVLWTLPELEGTLGIGSHAEVSFEYEYLWLDPTGRGMDSYDSGDLRLWTKFGLFPARVRDLSLRFGVKLPNASEQHGLGTDATDFFASALYDLGLGPARLSLNAGVGLLGSTLRKQSQDDVFTWAAAVRAPVGSHLRFQVEGAGYSGPFGLHRRRDFATLSAVLGWQTEGWRFDLAGRRGIQDALSWGLVAGVTFER